MVTPNNTRNSIEAETLSQSNTKLDEHRMKKRAFLFLNNLKYQHIWYNTLLSPDRLYFGLIYLFECIGILLGSLSQVKSHLPYI